jgi:hypothetical protein
MPTDLIPQDFAERIHSSMLAWGQGSQMPLPASIRVKLSSEDAGSITLTDVVVRDMPVRELVEVVLGTAGKDAARIREVLGRGTFVSGASRYRWEGLAIEDQDLTALLASFPAPDPGRPFDPRHCRLMVLRAGLQQWELPPGSSLWDTLVKLAASGDPRYAGYSYRYRADRFDLPLAKQQFPELRVRQPLTSLELYLPRE